jgi:hypothetical protein
MRYDSWCREYQSRKDTQLSQLKKDGTVTTTYVRIWGKYITAATTKAAVSPITTKTFNT